MKQFILSLAFILAAMSVQAQITFTSDSTFVVKDTAYIQLDTISVSGNVWYMVTQVQLDQAGNRVTTSFPPKTKRQMRQFAKEGIENENNAIKSGGANADAARNRKTIYTAIRDALNDKR